MRSLRLAVPILLATAFLLSPNAARSQVARNVTLVSHLKQYSSYSNSWSYIHPDGREYVALGTRFGLSIVRLTDPANPVEVGFFPSINCTTRDADQYQTYIYAIGAVCGNASPGLTIISMADPDHPVLVSELHGVLESSENITIDQARGLLWAAEVNELQAAGGIRILSLADPVNPTLLYANDAYGVHDVTVKGTRAYLNDLSNETIHVLDATNPSSPVEITSFPTGGSAHSAWPTEDDRYLVTTNEEPNGVLVFDIQNPLQPVQTWHEALDPDAPAHYPRVLGSRAFIAHSLAGVRILDLSNPAWPVESGYLDTYLGDNEIFAGVYDTCPFYPSGIATATDMADGLYVYRVDPPNYGLVRGTVMDGRSPLEGATVRVPPNGPSMQTGPDGRYGLAPDAVGSVTIELSKFGYTTQTAVRTVSIGSDQTVSFAAQKAATGTLKGTVVESINQSGLGAAEVTCVDTPLLATTTARGTYSLSKTPVGSYTVRADRPGYVPAEVTASIVAKKTTQVNFSLAPAPFYDDAEVDRGWTLGAPGDNATAGQWIRAVPIASISSTGFELQPGADHTPDPGTMCFVTGNGPVGGGQNLADVDGGKTTLISPVLPLAAVPDPRIAFWRFYYSNNAGPNASPLVTEISNDGGANWVVCDSIHAATRAWKRFEIRVTDFFPTPADVRVRVIAQDRSTSSGSTVEALIDDFEYYSGTGLSSGTAGPPTAIQPPTSPLLVRALDRSRDGETLELSAAGGLSRATVRIFDIRGRLVRTLHEGALVGGTTRLVWNRRSDQGERVANGVYIVQARAGQARAETKIVLIR
jgi:choice-of-anchor B domain-containing protein